MTVRHRVGRGSEPARTWLAIMKLDDKVYGFDVVYLTSQGEELRCHYVGDAATVRRKTMLRSHAREVLSMEPMTEAHWRRVFGSGRT